MQLAIQARLYRLLCAAWRHRYLLVIPPLILPIVGFFLSTVAPRIYDNHTSFLVQESATLNPFLKDLSVDSQIQQRMKALNTLLHSRHILQKVAGEEGLYSESASDYQKDRIISRLSANLKVSLFGSDLIRITYRSDSKEGMDTTLKAVREVFIDQLLAPERSSMRNSEAFLLTQLDTQRSQLETAEAALAKFKSKHVMQLPSLFNNNVTSISELRQLIAEKEIEFAGQEAVMASLHTQLIRNNPIVAQLENDIVSHKRELSTLLSRYTLQHSKVVIANAKLRRLEQELKDLIELTAKIDNIDELERLWQSSSIAPPGNIDSHSLSLSPNNEIESARLRYSRIKQELSQLRKQHDGLFQLINSSSDIEQTLQTLTRDLQVQNKIYQETLDRYERAKVTGALGSYEQRDRIKIIDKAYVPSSPSNMPRLLYVILGVVAGIGLGVGTAIILELTDSRIRYIKDVQKIANVPVLARLPRIKDNHYIFDAQLLVGEKRPSTKRFQRFKLMKKS
ncbi:GumC family protein [Marinomonas algicola]|uniref:GumC family protein n=1 Tax=Marinomonas algicola TaxID=2773454 RepID=UPI00174A5F87|nr:GNVR domain-containing protein [Marinomonas algicola]